jgi:hypothetical protein
MGGEGPVFGFRNVPRDCQPGFTSAPGRPQIRAQLRAPVGQRSYLAQCWVGWSSSPGGGTAQDLYKTRRTLVPLVIVTDRGDQATRSG